MFKGSYSYSPGDIIKDLWKIEGQDVCIGMYIIYDMYSYDPYGREEEVV